MLLLRAALLPLLPVRQGKARAALGLRTDETDEESIVGTLRLLDSPFHNDDNSITTAPGHRHNGEVYSCAYVPDGGFVLSAGWDGQLRLWEMATGLCRVSLPVSGKPLSSCACSPDGMQWLSGSMEGMLGIWDGVSQQQQLSFVAHTRPISGIVFSPDGQHLATSSWDRLIAIRKVGKEREGWNLSGHQDIVAGCRFTVDGKQLISWSYDGTIKLWDLAQAQETASLAAHTDRVTALALSPDGRCALSGGRDGTIRLWDLDTSAEVATASLGAEVRTCFYLLDAESVAVTDAVGRLFLLSVPTFEVQSQLQLPFKAMCGQLAPSGMQLALGGEDGAVHFVALEGFEGASLFVTPSASVKPRASLLDRVFGKTRLTQTYTYTCPACRQVIESLSLPSQPVACPRCRRRLRINPRVSQLQGS